MAGRQGPRPAGQGPPGQDGGQHPAAARRGQGRQGVGHGVERRKGAGDRRSGGAAGVDRSVELRGEAARRLLGGGEQAGREHSQAQRRPRGVEDRPGRRENPQGGGRKGPAGRHRQGERRFQERLHYRPEITSYGGPGRPEERQGRREGGQAGGRGRLAGGRGPGGQGGGGQRRRRAAGPVAFARGLRGGRLPAGGPPGHLSQLSQHRGG